jgi:hypothetical protein
MARIPVEVRGVEDCFRQWIVEHPGGLSIG